MSYKKQVEDLKKENAQKQAIINKYEEALNMARLKMDALQAGEQDAKFQRDTKFNILVRLMDKSSVDKDTPIETIFSRVDDYYKKIVDWYSDELEATKEKVNKLMPSIPEVKKETPMDVVK